MCDQLFTENSKIRIMPDVHAGSNCTIGTTMTITDKAVPNIVGVDIGCGMYTVNLGKVKEIEKALKDISWSKRVTTIPEEMCYLYGKYLSDYIHDVEICQRFAVKNREIIAEIIMEKAGLTNCGSFHTVHNYIDTDEMILRKGAIAAHKGEMVLIPVNMRDGCILDVIKESVDVIDIMKPVYNFKAG